MDLVSCRSSFLSDSGSFEFQMCGRNGSSGSLCLAIFARSFDLWESLVVALMCVVVRVELVRARIVVRLLGSKYVPMAYVM